MTYTHELLNSEEGKQLLENSEFYKGKSSKLIFNIYNEINNIETKKILMKNFLEYSPRIYDVIEFFNIYYDSLGLEIKTYVDELLLDVTQKILEANSREKEFIRYMFKEKDGNIKLDSRSIKIYNSLSVEQFRALLELCYFDKANITYDLFSAIEDKEKLVLPYSGRLYRSDIFINDEMLNFYINNETFLSGIKQYDINDILSYIGSNEMNEEFAVKYIGLCSSIQDLLYLRSTNMVEYISFDRISESLKKLFSDFISKLETTDEYDEETLKIIRSIFGYIYMNNDALSISIFNIFPTDLFKKVLGKTEVRKLKPGIVESIDDYEKIIMPYDLGAEEFLENEEFAKKVIESPIFYEASFENYTLDKIITSLPTNELRFEFINQLYINKKDILKKCIENSSEFKRSKFFLYVSDNIIIDFLKEGVNVDKVFMFFSILSEEGKSEVYKSNWFNESYDTKNLKKVLFKILPDDIIYEEFQNLYSPIIMFDQTRRTVFLKLFIDNFNIKELSSINNLFGIKSLLYITDNHLEQIGDYKDKLFAIIDLIPDDVLVALFFEFYPDDNQTIMKDYIFSKVKEKVEKNNLIIENLSTKVLITRNKEILNLILNHVSKSDLILLSVRHPYFNIKVLELLQKNPNYFCMCDIENFDKFKGLPIDINNLESLMKIYQYLNYEQQKAYYVTEFLKNDEQLKNRYIEDVRKNSDLLFSLDHLSLFDIEDVQKIISTISIDRFMYLVYYKSLTREVRDIVAPYLKSRVDDVSFFLNDKSSVDSIMDTKKSHFVIFSLFEEEDAINLINKVENLNFLTFASMQCSKKFVPIINDRMSEILNLIIEIPLFENYPSFRVKEEGFKFYDKLSFESFMGLCFREIKYATKGSNNYNILVEYLNNKLEENFDLIYNIAITEQIDILIEKLPPELSNKILNEIESSYETLKSKYPKLQEYIVTLSDKANYVGAIKNNLINDINIDLVYKMLDENKYLFSSMDFRLLQPDLLKMGSYFLSKVSRYPASSIKVNKIYEQDKNKYNLLVLLSNKIRTEKNDSIYDYKIEIIINYLLMHNIQIPDNIDDITLNNIETYIFDYYYIKNSKFTNLPITNYIDERNNLIDKQINECDKYDNLINLIYLKHFGINKAMIELFLFQYVENWNTVNHLCENDLPNKYIELIFAISSIKDINTLKETSKTLDIYTVSDYLNITGIMINTYNKSLKGDLLLKRPGIKKEIEIDGRKIEVEDITSSFGIILHSTDAYGSMPLINDNYYDSWNNNPNTRNHGICCSYISNSSYGTAAVKDNGVMLGFEINDENSVPIYAPYDLGTINTGFTLTSRFKPYYCRLQSISDITRHTHNELDLERRINEKEGGSQLRQPQYIIIFEDMTEQVKKNSIKAYEDFRAHGIDVKLKYIDRVKNCHMEAELLNEMIEEFRKTYDMSLLHQIINKYESNICSCDFLGTGKQASLELIDQHELFKTKEVRQLINETIEYIKNIQNIEQRNMLIFQFIQLINIEKRKFDLIDDFDKGRKHKFELYDEKLKYDINILKELLGQEIVEEKKYN